MRLGTGMILSLLIQGHNLVFIVKGGGIFFLAPDVLSITAATISS